MERPGLAWYCARTKPKHEHIAAGNVRKTLGMEVFHPRLALERATRRGPVRVVEALFPGYIFVRCELAQGLDDLRYVNGISSLVRFGLWVPQVPEAAIEDLRRCFADEEPMPVQDHLLPADEVVVSEGAFAGMQAVVLKVLPARRRVQILLEVLGRPTPVEVDRAVVTPVKNQMANKLPALAVKH